MPRIHLRPFPSVDKQIRSFAARLKLARLRRSLSAGLFAERLGVSRDTLHRLEKGDANIAIGTYLRALRILGLDADMDAVARDDELGRKLQDLQLPQRVASRSRSRSRIVQPSGPALPEEEPPAPDAEPQ